MYTDAQDTLGYMFMRKRYTWTCMQLTQLQYGKTESPALPSIYFSMNITGPRILPSFPTLTHLFFFFFHDGTAFADCFYSYSTFHMGFSKNKFYKIIMFHLQTQQTYFQKHLCNKFMSSADSEISKRQLFWLLETASGFQQSSYVTKWLLMTETEDPKS